MITYLIILVLKSFHFEYSNSIQIFLKVTASDNYHIRVDCDLPCLYLQLKVQTRGPKTIPTLTSNLSMRRLMRRSRQNK